MTEQDSFIIQDNRKKAQGRENLDVYSGNSFGSQVTFTVGVSYLLASSVGLMKGVFEGFPRNFKLPKKLLLNNFFNALGKNQSVFAQTAASAGLMYYAIGSSMNFFFEDQLEDLTDLQKNVAIGSVTGFIFNTGAGGASFVRGTAGGAAIIGGLTLLTEYLYAKHTIAFQMKF